MKPCLDCGKKADHGNYCYCCLNRRYRANNRMKAAYFTLRDNSKRRNKVFEISFEYFAKFCKQTDYLNKKGRFKHSYHIDRVNEEKGYIEGNLQLLLNPDNVKKYVKYRQTLINGKKLFFVSIIKEPNFQGVPF